MIYFLSDAHLGSLAIEDGQAHQQKVIDLLEQMSQDATAIFLLGDTFDFWMEYCCNRAWSGCYHHNR